MGGASSIVVYPVYMVQFLNRRPKSVGSRRELVANSVHTADADADATRQLSRVGVGDVYWAL